MRILVVEDEPTLQAQLVQALASANYTVEAASDGQNAQYLGEVESFDAVVLDLGLPVMDGLTVLRAWRAAGRNMPVLILTARSAWHEKVSAWMPVLTTISPSPFTWKNCLRDCVHCCAARDRNPAQNGNAARFGSILVRRVLVDGQPLVVTSHEFKILSLLMHRVGEVLSRTELSEHIYPQDSDRDSNTIEVFIGRLRKKLPVGSIETVRGLGYRLVDINAAA